MTDEMNYQAFWKFIKLLHDNDLLQHVELIGSWCEYLYAQALHHVSILKTYSMQIDMFGMSITVPTPEAYTVHKIIINGQRGNKSEKDNRAIENILPFLDADKLDEIISNLTKREKKAYDDYMKK